VVSPRVYAQHNITMKLFYFCIPWPSIYRIITRNLINLFKCEWEYPLGYIPSFESSQGEILGRSWGLVLNYIMLEVIEARTNS
jgi:hypothetical protein